MKNPSLDKAISIQPNGLGAIMGEGSALSRLGRYEEAIIYFDKILSMEPNHVYTLIEMGVALDEF
jgi:tetratricopeptide (TPR) repeat protein